jgi:hypothetical protein
MKFNTLNLFLLLFIVSSTSAQKLSEFFSKTDSFFKANVVDGRVKYTAIKENPPDLRSILESVKDISIPKTDAAKYQAFWINAYNLLVIDGVVKNYPLKSPLDVAGFFDKAKYNIGGENITLNDIENKLLRGNFPTEARFHFVLVCAGLGCPPIINTAYKPSSLDAQLQKQTILALNNPNFIQFNKNKLKISQLFEWYKGDFELNGDVIHYINSYRTEKLPEKVKFFYYPYDWTLNEVKEI